MKKIIASVLGIACCMAYASAQVKMPQPSPTQVIKQEFGMGTIELTYSRPNAKGRKIYGDLVPFNKLWRTGANAATTIVFSDAIELAGKKVEPGSYALYTIPGVDSWEIILNKGVNNWGIEGYKESEDVLRFKVEPAKTKTNLETFTMQFVNLKAQSCELQLLWAKTLVSIPVSCNIKERLKAQIEAAMLTDKKPYWQAAQYYYEYESNLTKALDNCTKAIEVTEKPYWIWLYKAKIQRELGDKPGARTSAQKSLQLAKEEKNEDYVKMNEDLLRKLK